MTKGMTFRVTIEIDDDEEGYHAYCSCLPGLHVWGKTIEEAKSLARDAVLAYIESLIKHNEPIPLCQMYKEELKPSTHKSVEDLVLQPA